MKKWLPHGQPSSKVNFEPCFLASLKWSLWLSGPYTEAPYELIASSFLILPPSKVESMLLEYLFKPCYLTGCSWQTTLLLNPAPSSLKWISSGGRMGLIPCQINSLDSQREQLTLCDASNSFPPYWCLRRKCRNRILMLMMSHYPDLGKYRASDWLKIFQTSRKIISSPVFQAALYV